jgi:hypothetical protein
MRRRSRVLFAGCSLTTLDSHAKVSGRERQYVL